MSVENIVNNYVLSHIENSGLGFLNQQFLFRNMSSEQNYSVLNQNLLSIYCQQNNIKNNVFFGSYLQIKEMGGRITTGKGSGALLAYYRSCTSGGNTWGRLAYYHSFPLCNTDIYSDFSGIQNDYLYPDKLYEAETLIDRGAEKLQKRLPVNNPIDIESGFRQTIISLAGLTEPKTEDNLVINLTAGYLLAQCGLSLNIGRENPYELLNKMRDDPAYFIKSAGTAQKKVKSILNDKEEKYEKR